MIYPTFEELNKNIIDLNNPPREIPSCVQDKFWEMKQSEGALPMGISHILEIGWFVVTPSRLENNGVLFFYKNKEK